MIEVTILSRQDCHYCDVVNRMAQRIGEDLDFNLIKVDIDRDEQLIAQYGHRVPVVLIDHIEVFAGRLTEHDLRRAIKRARWSRPISRILSRLRTGLKRG